MYGIISVMESYLSEDQSQITFTIDENRNEDHVDRALRNLKELQRENESLRQEMQRIKANPKAFIKPIRDEFSTKINQLREENDSLWRMVEKTKIPAYCEMTKKKIIQPDYDDQTSNHESMRGSYRNRNPLDEIESNFDKNDARSTCLNYNQTEIQGQQTYVVGHNDQEQRDMLMSEIRLMLEKAEAFEDELEKITRKEREELRGSSRRDQATERELARIYEYKKKLIKLLSKLKNREIAMKDLVQTYRQMYEETFHRLKEATAVLQTLREARISADVDQKYAQVLQLEQRLQSINAQLQQMDETKWLEQIVRELTQAVRRMGLEVPKCENNRELIDQLCGMLIECHIASRKDGQAKLAMLKQYHEEEKRNNSKYIMALKSKEQALGRRLIDLQMDK